jgi:tryptophan synthase beta chain
MWLAAVSVAAQAPQGRGRGVDAGVERLRAYDQAAVERGRAAFGEKCSACHRANARGGQGFAGPDLLRSVLVLQDANGNIELTHSVSAGLDYAAVGPEHAWLRDMGRAEYSWIGDNDALDAFQQLARTEGIIPALESAHGVSYACRLAQDLGPSAFVLVNLSGRGDKDVDSVARLVGQEGGQARV